MAAFIIDSLTTAMNIENFDNDLSSDDSDFCPDKHEQSVSENSCPEDEPVDSDEARDTSKTVKRKKTSSKRRKAKPAAETKNEEVETEKEVDAEEEKRKADAIWADFLNSAESPHVEPAKTNTGPVSSTATSAATTKKIIPVIVPVPAAKEIFEFAGEKVEIPSKSSEPENSKPAGFKRTSSGGLSSALNQLTKKNKLSVLEKTKIDWDGFKSNEGIGEELQTHNRGRDG